MNYRLELVQMDGTPVRELTPDATIGEVSWALNDAGSLTFGLPATHAANDLITVAATEVRLMLNGVAVWWGVVVAAQTTYATTSYRCAGLLWYLKHRIVGDAERTNFTTNGNFETDSPGILTPTGWSQATYGNINVTRVVGSGWLEGDFVPQGSQCVRLKHDNADEKRWIWQNVTGLLTGHHYWVSAWWMISEGAATNANDTACSGKGYGARGFEVQLRSDNKAPRTKNFPLGPKRVEGRWRRVVLHFHVRSGMVNPYFKIRLGAVQGTVYWDDVAVYRNNRVARDVEDQTVIADKLVQHAQSTSYGKSNLQIATSCPASGKYRKFRTFHHNHDVIFDRLAELASYKDGIDFEIDPTDRTFKTYYPTIGQHWALHPLEIGRTVLDFAQDEDGTDPVNTVIYQGPELDFKSQAAREEGRYKDASTHGGIVHEAAFSGSRQSTRNGLNDRAEAKWKAKRARETVPTVTVPASWLADGLRVGDTVPALIRHGRIDLTTTNLRIVTMALDPASGQLALTLNRA